MARSRSFMLLAVVCACAAKGANRPEPTDRTDAAIALADEYVSKLFARFPEEATIAGFPGADHAAITDNRPEASRAWHAQEDALLARARELRGLVPGSRPWVAHAIVLEALEASVAMRACRTELWGVAAVEAIPVIGLGGGWQDTYAALAEVQPVGTPEARRAAIARLAAVPRFVDQEISNLREGMRLGFAATSANVERVIASLDAMLALPPGKWPYVSPAERDPDGELRDALERIVARDLVPATRRYRDFLAREYLRQARRDAGVASFPGGHACYRAAIRAGTTRADTPERLRDRGVEELARIREEMKPIAERSFGTSDVASVLRRVSTRPEFRYDSAAEVVSRARSAVERARAGLPRAFSRLPRCAPKVRPYPDAIASTGKAASSLGSMGSGCYRGVYFVNSLHATGRSRLGAETTAFHETWPGHFLEAALKVEAPGPSTSWRHVVNNAYSEGWALYAEGLADELGLFSSDLDRLGMLREQAFRAARLVADTGLHAFGWSREQAAAYLADATGEEPETFLPEVDRYCAWPGQALGYMAGALEIRAARADAERILGARFDLRSFHDIVLDAQLPLPALRERVIGLRGAPPTGSHRGTLGEAPTR